MREENAFDCKGAVVWMTATSLALKGCGDSETSTDPAEGAEAAGAEEATGEEAGDEEGGETAAEEGGETAAEEGGETAAEEGGEVAGEEAGGGEAAVEEEGGESPAVFEDCVNGSDDDGDGLVDCEDQSVQQRVHVRKETAGTESTTQRRTCGP